MLYIPILFNHKDRKLFSIMHQKFGVFPSKISLYAKKIQIIYNVAFFIAFIWF